MEGGEKRPQKKRRVDAVYMKTYDEFRLSTACLLFLEPLAAAVRAVLVRRVRVDVAVRAVVPGHDGGTDERVVNSGVQGCAGWKRVLEGSSVPGGRSDFCTADGGRGEER